MTDQPKKTTILVGATMGAMSALALAQAAKAAAELAPQNDAPDGTTVTNIALRRVDAVVETIPVNLQLGILAMATVLALRRFFVANGLVGRDKRNKTVKNLIRELDSKFRKYCLDAR